MNWLTNKVLPKIRNLTKSSDTPDNLWVKCPECGQMLFHSELAQNQSVCSHCDHHMRLGPKERFEALFDGGKYDVIELPDVQVDPLKFRDSKKYLDRLKDARNKTGDKDAMIVAHGKLKGNTAVVGVQNFNFMGGSLGMAVGEAIIAAAKLAILQKAPLILFTSAGGARMQEGILSLMQMPRTTVAIQRLKEAKLPFIVVLTDPTTGGVTASYAMLGDIQISEPGALICFAGPRVIEETIREKLPEGFQRAEFLLEKGMLDMVVHRHELKDTLARIVDLTSNKLKTVQPEIPKALKEPKKSEKSETKSTEKPAEEDKKVEPAKADEIKTEK
ncbi:acetyl-CoA carboxylase, carboxyltransferase subunit beta [Sneathiella limimaris]|uniref:acetyl-CoA carboxylase, carboxyltransferase subunit beta n=1 Tax=Sneathiella limimaris TaxID=1964213 RepID=UPI00146A96DB|nr:acetyl-CoA carboxylase, carboxyltransferase subunit beta [Sneathiella limimaris]